MRWTAPVTLGLAVAGLMLAWLALADSSLAAAGLKTFAGTFQGTGMSETADGKPVTVNARDFDVTITLIDEGFEVEWRTTEFRLTPGANRREESVEHISFVPTSRPGFYRAVEAVDPSAGRPSYWAYIAENVLTVHAMVANDAGGTEFLTWRRTVEGKRMQLLFQRSLDGRILRSVKGSLVRIAE